MSEMPGPEPMGGVSVPEHLEAQVEALGATERFHRDLQPYLDAIHRGDEGAVYRLNVFYLECSFLLDTATALGGLHGLDHLRASSLADDHIISDEGLSTDNDFWYI